MSWFLLLLVLLGTTLSACEVTEPRAPPNLARIEINRRLPSLLEGDTTLLRVTGYDTAGAVIGVLVVSWTSGDPTVARVSARGVVSGLRAGPVTIRARLGAASDSVTAVVVPKLGSQNREIAFVSDTSKAPTFEELWLMREDGGDLHKVSTPGRYLRSYAWSRDGTYLAMAYWITEIGQEPLLDILDVDHGTRFQLRTPSEFPEVSPDKRFVSFGRYDPTTRTASIWTSRLDGTNERQVTSLPGYALEPVWSPDVRQIAFRLLPSYPGPSEVELWVVNVDGTDAHRLAPRARGVSWSPDGKLVLFDDFDRVWVLGREETSPLPLTQSVGITTIGQGPGLARWSSDGSRIVYNIEMELRVIRSLDGRLLAKNPSVSEGTGGFSPDGTRLVFLRRNDQDGGSPSVMVARTDATDARFLTSRRNTRSPSWRP